MKNLLIFLLLSVLAISGLQAQKAGNIAPENLPKLRQFEDSLITIFTTIRTAPVEKNRVDANNQLIPVLVQALKIPNAYNYPFDSLKNNISILKAPDNSFKIFTWMLVKQNLTYQYFGVIQKNNSQIELLPIYDKSAQESSPEIKIFTNESWYGALYYGIHQYTHNDSTFYLLFGWDGFNKRSDKKLVDVMYFDAEGKTVFGAPVFEKLELEKDHVNNEICNRFILEFKEGSLVALRYDADQDLIIYDFLTPEDEESERVTGSDFALVPDGTYQGMKLTDGVWKAVPKVFHVSLEKAPVYKKDTKKKNKKKARKKSKKRKDKKEK